MLLKRALAALIVCLVLPYALSPIYRFPVPQRFGGSRLWNPYSGGHGTWLRANFHAHGSAWGGLTNGAQPDPRAERVIRPPEAGVWHGEDFSI